MRRIAWVLLLLFAFTIPWEFSLDLGEPLGNISRLVGLLLLLVAIPAILQVGGLRAPGPVQWLALAFFLWICCSYSRTASGRRSEPTLEYLDRWLGCLCPGANLRLRRGVLCGRGRSGAHRYGSRRPSAGNVCHSNPLFVSSRVFYRFLVAMRRTDLILYCGIINLALDIVLNLILMRWMGIAGIALATSLWTVSTFFFLWYWSRRLLSRNLSEESSDRSRYNH